MAYGMLRSMAGGVDVTLPLSLLASQALKKYICALHLNVVQVVAGVELSSPID
jgi:hypothetical protein